ncbi:hypothetical protein AB0P13_26065 [Rhodococcus pyridinivorans]|uniref:hypothetical protein n=1 Tax=Rhodococcus pyridinivorans TaxID=103816 RepID=UPI00344A339E
MDKVTGKAVVRLIDTGPGTRPDKPADPAGHTYGRTGARSKKKKKKNPAEETSKKQRHSTEEEPNKERRQKKRKYIVVSDSGYIHTVSAGLPGLGKRR